MIDYIKIGQERTKIAVACIYTFSVVIYLI